MKRKGVLIGLVTSVILAFFALAGVFFLNFDAQADVPQGLSASYVIFSEEWQENIRLMEETANALNINVKVPLDVEAYHAALSKIQSSELASIEYLDLSGAYLSEIPFLLRHYTGLKKLDISNNQIIEIPQFILKKDGLELIADQNLLSEDSGFTDQSTLFALDKTLPSLDEISFFEIFEADRITQIIDGNIWVSSKGSMGGEKTSPLYDGLYLKIDYEKSANGKFSSFIDLQTGVILKSAEVELAFVVTNQNSTLRGKFFSVKIQLKAPDFTQIDMNLWLENEAFTANILSNLNLSSIDEINTAVLMTVRKLKIDLPDLAELPTVISQFSRLEELEISSPLITDFTPLVNLQSLRSLKISGGNLTSLPEGIAELPRLERIDLSDNKLSAEGINQLTRLVFIKDINLSGNLLTTLPHGFTALANLETLNLSDNAFIEFPKDLIYNSSLTALDISDNQIAQIDSASESFAIASGWNLRNNLLEKRFGNQKTLMPIDEDEMVFLIRGQYNYEALALSVKSKITLSDGASLSLLHDLEILSLDEKEISTLPFMDENGIINQSTMVSVFAMIEDCDRPAVSLVIKLETDPVLLQSVGIEEKKPSEIQQTVIDRINSPDAGSFLSETTEKPLILEGSLIQALKQRGKNLAVSVQAPEEEPFINYSWQISGKQIKYLIPLNLKLSTADASVLEAISPKIGGKEYIALSFENEGLLPGNTVITLRFKEMFEKHTSYYLYYIDEASGKLEFAGGVDTENYRASFTIDHCSDYIISKGIIASASGNPAAADSFFAGSKAIQKSVFIVLVIIAIVLSTTMIFRFGGEKTGYEMPREKEYARFLTNPDILKEFTADINKPSPEKKEKEASENNWKHKEMYELPVFISSSGTAGNTGDLNVIWENKESTSENLKGAVELKTLLREKFMLKKPEKPN